MSTYDEHKKMRPVLELVRSLDISSSPAPDALYDPLGTGFNIWCTPNDHPRGEEWDNQELYTTGAYAQKCSFVGTAMWGWTDEKITHIELETTAYELRDIDVSLSYKDITNRPNDIEWAIEKIQEVFSRAGVECPPIHLS